jgi:hypothetical protein
VRERRVMALLRVMVVPMIDQAILTAALEGLELQKAKLDEHIATVRALIGGRKKPGPKPKAAAVADDGDAPPKKRKKRVMSAEGRARIAAAQQKRWAEARQAKG